MDTQKQSPFFLLLLLSIGFIILIANYTVDLFLLSKEPEKVALNNAIKKSKERERFLLDYLERTKHAISTVRNHPSLNKVLNESKGFTSLNNFFYALSSSHPDIMKLSFINSKGKEIISVERNIYGGKVKQIKTEFLQDRSKDYYFIESAVQAFDKIIYSALDLNIEHNQVQKPYKETLRLMMPVGVNDEFSGVIIINYFIKPLLKSLFKAPLYNMLLVDQDGEIIIHHDNTKSWSKYNNNPNLVDIFGDEANKILSQELYKGDNLVSRRLELPLKLNFI